MFAGAMTMTRNPDSNTRASIRIATCSFAFLILAAQAAPAVAQQSTGTALQSLPGIYDYTQASTPDPAMAFSPPVQLPFPGGTQLPGVNNGAPLVWKPGMVLSGDTGGIDINPTDNIALARRQASAYPDNAEASFILAVALTRTPYVEQAISEVRRARKLAAQQGGPEYFDKMVARYEEMLKAYPNDNKVRYGLAWAYYMKAYLIAEQSRKQARMLQAWTMPAAAPRKQSLWEKGLDIALAVATNRPPQLSSIPHLEGAMDKADPSALPLVARHLEEALQKLDELLARDPGDVWARTYHAFLKAEYTGNLAEAMSNWQRCIQQAPNNPAPYFFLADAYMRQGNVATSIQCMQRALALRANWS